MFVAAIAATSLYWTFWGIYRRRAEYTQHYGYPWTPNTFGFIITAALSVLSLLGIIAFTWIHLTESMNDLDAQRGETR